VPTDRQILTTLEQVRPLTKLQPDSRIEVWQQAVQAAGGRFPLGALKGVVERLMERDSIPTYKLDDVLLISAASGELKNIRAAGRSPPK